MPLPLTSEVGTESQKVDFREKLEILAQGAVRTLWDALEVQVVSGEDHSWRFVAPVFPGRGVGSARKLRAFLKAVVALDFVYKKQFSCQSMRGQRRRTAMKVERRCENQITPAHQSSRPADLARLLLADLIGALALSDFRLVFNPESKLLMRSGNDHRKKRLASETELNLWADNFRKRYFEAALEPSPGTGSSSNALHVQKYLELFKNPKYVGERKMAEEKFVSMWLGAGAKFGLMWTHRAVPPPENAKWQFLSFRDNFSLSGNGERGAGGGAALAAARQEEVEEDVEEEDLIEQEPPCVHCMERRRLKLLNLSRQPGASYHWEEGDLVQSQPYSSCSCGFNGLLGPGNNLTSLTVRHVARRLRRHHQQEDEEVAAKAIFLLAQLRVESWAGRIHPEDRNAPSAEDRARATLDVQRELLVLLKAYLPAVEDAPGRGSRSRSGSTAHTGRTAACVRGLIYLDRVLHARGGGIVIDDEGEQNADDLPEDQHFPESEYDTSWRDVYSNGASEELASSIDEHGELGPADIQNSVDLGNETNPNQFGSQWDWDLANSEAGSGSLGDEMSESSEDADSEGDDHPEQEHRLFFDDLEPEQQFAYAGTDGDYLSDFSTTAAGSQVEPENAHLQSFTALVEDWKLQFPWTQRSEHYRRTFLAAWINHDLEQHVGGVDPAQQLMATTSSLGRVLALQESSRPPTISASNNDPLHQLLLDVEGDLLRDVDEKAPHDQAEGNTNTDMERDHRPKQLSRSVVLHPELEVALLAISLAYATDVPQTPGGTATFHQSLFGFTSSQLVEAQQWLVGQMDRRENSWSWSTLGSWSTLEIPENEYAAYEGLLRDNLFPRVRIERLYN